MSSNGQPSFTSTPLNDNDYLTFTEFVSHRTRLLGRFEVLLKEDGINLRYLKRTQLGHAGFWDIYRMVKEEIGSSEKLYMVALQRMHEEQEFPALHACPNHKIVDYLFVLRRPITLPIGHPLSR